MPVFIGKCSKIRQIVKLRQILRRWRHKAASRNKSNRIPSDVPSGHVAVNVGTSSKRFVVRTTYLNHPLFQKLLVQSEEIYGFSHQQGPLCIPCDELLFEDILRFLSRSESKNSSSARFVNLEDFQRHCYVDFLNDSRPLLSVEKSFR
ncbi:hypothetical protein IFM89_001093 [Coptis chinensis]|uniref:Small auxin up regulated protein n=1 Tax=Coptis chinensis TaxID=261450 RepID=A0A835HJR0_9MAGN|nr:hypothetical protein IFM89_001093 [Coptis chinensis]